MKFGYFPKWMFYSVLNTHPKPTTLNQFHPLSANRKKWSNQLKTICRQKPTNFLSVSNHFLVLVFKELRRFESLHSLQSKFKTKNLIKTPLLKANSGLKLVKRIICICFKIPQSSDENISIKME